MVHTSLGDDSFRIVITKDFIKPYKNIMNLYAIIFLNKKSSLYLEGFAVLWLNRVDNYLWITLI